MISFVYRLSALGLKFACPLAIVYLTSQAVLGEYYLSTTYLTLVIMLIALETAVPFSAAYLRAKTQRGKQHVFSSLILTQGLLASVLSIPPTLICAYLAHLPAQVFLLLPVVFVVESCSNEVGRFFWNIGKSQLASRRDLYRAVSLTMAVLVSVVVNHSIITPVSLLLLTAMNLLLLHSELKQWGEGIKSFKRLKTITHASLWRLKRSIFSTLTVSGPLVVHGQVLTLQPLLERYLIERKLGLAFVGAYSFQYSIIQTGASLLLMPRYAKLRQQILSAEGENNQGKAHKASISYFWIVMLLISILAIGAYIAVPVLSILLKKSITSDAMIILVAAIAGGANSYAAAVTPLYAKRNRLFIANILSIIAMIPLGLFIVWPNSHGHHIKLLVLLIIASSAVIQAIIRIGHSLNKVRSKQIKPI